MNSIRNVKRAIEYEIKRQQSVLTSGAKVDSETRLFDVDTGSTHGMREKEEADDYRYFADPDLPPFTVTDEWLEEIKSSLGAIPSDLKAIFINEHGLSAYDAAVLTEEKLTADWFLALVNGKIEPKTAANWIMGPVKAQLNLTTDQDFRLNISSLIELVNLVQQKRVNYNVAVKQILPELAGASALTALELVDQLGVGLEKVGDELEGMISEIIKDMPAEVNAYKKGKKALIQRFMGEVMKRSKGKAEPQATLALLQKMLN